MNLKDLFPLNNSEQWLKVIQKELKDIEYQSLIQKNNDGIKIEPIYHAHQDFEQPIRSHFPEIVSFYHFPQSETGFLEPSTIFEKNNHTYKTLFLSLPYESLKKIPDLEDSYVLIEDFFYESSFLDILSAIPETVQKFKGWVLDLSYLQECGANNIDTLSFGFFILDKLPRNLSIILKVAVSNDFYAEIAKLRALNYILQNFGFQNIKIWVKTAEINKSLLHLENNLIRLTSETVAAVLGGCDYITIIPFDLNYNEEFSIRISSNILKLLKHESYLDKVSDPLRGSYAIEKLTHSYTTQIFQQLLFWKSLNSKELWKNFTQKTLENLQKIVEQYQAKQKLLVGVNIYPYAKETRQEIKQDFPKELKPVRIAQLL